MRTAVVFAVAVLVSSALGQPDPQREWMVVRDTFPEFRGVPDSVTVARDMAPGVGIFEYCRGPTGFHCPLADVNVSSSVQVALADACDSVMYFSRLSPWCRWDDPVRIPFPQPDPFCPSYNIAAQRSGDDVCLTWVYSPAGFSQKPGFFRISTDGGVNWGPSTQLDWPDAYGGDTLASFHSSSLFPYYDKDGDLRIVAAVGPLVNDTNFILPAQIWHWKDEEWSLVHRAEPESLRAPVGFNALIAGRPSLGEMVDDDFFCVWEEFEGTDVEPGPPARLRAVIKTSYSPDGQYWSPAMLLSDSGHGVSRRFPCIVDQTADDTIRVVYIVDQHAGFAAFGEGPATDNPIVVLKFSPI